MTGRGSLINTVRRKYHYGLREIEVLFTDIHRNSSDSWAIDFRAMLGYT